MNLLESMMFENQKLTEDLDADGFDMLMDEIRKHNISIEDLEHAIEVIKDEKSLSESNEPYFGSSKYEYDEDSEDDRITYDVISEHLSAMFDNIGIDPQYVSQLSRFERVMGDLIYLYKAYKG